MATYLSHMRLRILVMLHELAAVSNPAGQKLLGFALDEAMGDTETKLAEQALSCGNRRAKDACGEIGPRQFHGVPRYIPQGTRTIRQIF